MITVVLYSRPGCHLCEQAEADLQALQETYPHRLEIVDVESRPQLLQRYGLEVPVVEVGPYRLKAPFTRQELQITLAAAQDREQHIERIAADREARQATRWTAADRINYFLSHHYMAIFNSLVALYLGLAILAPILVKAGATAPATVLYKAYGLVCHQLGYRSFYLFGEQFYYPRAAAHIPGVLTFQQASGLEEGSSAQEIFAARNFIGNEQMGYKIALCQRDLAVYGGILLFGVLFSLSGWRIRALPWQIWLLLAVTPIAVDGLSQLISQPPLSLFPLRESTPALRVLTGGMFGFFTAWFGYPLVEESMVEMRQLMVTKRRRLFGETA